MAFKDVGGTAISTTVLNGGEQDVEGGGKANATFISSGGVVSVLAGGVTSGTSIANGGFEFVSAGGTSSAVTINGGTLELQAGASLGTGPVTFGGAGLDGRLTIGGTALSNVISGFVAGDTIDLAAVGFSRSNSLTFSSGTLTVSAGGSKYHFAHLRRRLCRAGGFYLKPDGNQDTSTGAGGTVIGYDQITSVSSSTRATRRWQTRTFRSSYRAPPR